MQNFKKITAGIVAISLTVMQLVSVLPAQAAVSDWQKGVNLVPSSTTDFGGNNFKQSLQNLKATGANYVSLVMPYYQSNIWSTDVAPGWNTPTDAALASAIDYAHGLGLGVALKMHVDPYDGNWRANIHPGDRDGWYRNYGNYLVHLATIGQAHNVELIVIGTELVDMAAYTQNGDNTRQWQNLIAKVRAVYSGKLTYNANSDNNTSGGIYQDEKDYIGFWDRLDYAGLSIYYNLNSDNQVSNLQGQWDYWNNNDLKGFQSRVGKPILFMEIGYRSVDGAHYQPWNWAMGGGPNMTEQANDYEALLSYWNNYGYVGGVYWWYWQTDPNAGGTGDTGYTPQNKPAQAVMTKWFTGAGGSGGGGTGGGTNGQYSFTASASSNPISPSAGSSVSLSATIKSMGSALSGGIVDLEVYDSNNSRVHQKFYENVSIPAGSSQTFSTNWTPSAAGTYHMSVGVFSGGWANTYYWNSNAATIAVGASSGGGGMGGPSTGSGQASPLNIWWPTDNAHVSGIVPFKAMVENIDVSQYRMYWAVGTGVRNEMANNATDYPHKEALVDLSGWNWNGSGPYPLTFTATQMDGSTVMTNKSINIWIP